MKWLSAVACALALGPGLALAQDEAPVEEVTEEAVEEVTEEAAPAEPAAEAAEPAVEEVAAEEPPADEAAAGGSGWFGPGYVDIYHVPTTTFGTTGLNAYGDGAGGRGQWQFWKALAISGEYTTQKFEDDTEFSDQRAGLGLALNNDNGDLTGVFVEFERLDFEDGTVIDGFGAHGRMSHAASEWFRFYGDLGYKRLESDLEKFSAFEFNAGVVASFGPFGVFADWRRNQLEGKDSGSRLHVEVVRVGARYAFGGAASASESE